jgi:hypothetical protein
MKSHKPASVQVKPKDARLFQGAGLGREVESCLAKHGFAEGTILYFLVDCFKTALYNLLLIRLIASLN